MEFKKDITFIICKSDGQSNFPDVEEYENLKGITQFISKSYAVSGPGQSRQVGLDWICSNSEIKEDDWVVFFDIDDKLAENSSLSLAIKMMDTCKDYDALEFLAQDVYPDKEPTLVDWFTQHYAVWSNAYKLKSIIDYKIRFPDNLLSYEDFFFNYCIDSIADCKRIGVRDVILYSYIRRVSSTGQEQIKSKTKKDWLNDNLLIWQEFRKWASRRDININPYVSYKNIVSGIWNVSSNLSELTPEVIEVFKEYKEIVQNYRDIGNKFNSLYDAVEAKLLLYQ